MIEAWEESRQMFARLPEQVRDAYESGIVEKREIIRSEKAIAKLVMLFAMHGHPYFRQGSFLFLFVWDYGPFYVPLWRKDGGDLCEGCRCRGREGTVVKALLGFVSAPTQPPPPLIPASLAPP